MTLQRYAFRSANSTPPPKTKSLTPSKVHQINYKGEHHQTQAIGALHPSPQRTPVIFQAGQSKAGKTFAALNAEAIFIGGGKPSDSAGYVSSIRADAAANVSSSTKSKTKKVNKTTKPGPRLKPYQSLPPNDTHPRPHPRRSSSQI